MQNGFKNTGFLPGSNSRRYVPLDNIMDILLTEYGCGIARTETTDMADFAS